MFVVIILNVINILSVLFGNEIIRFFNLEERYPKLGIFFKLRIKLQRYYLMWSVFYVIYLLYFLGKLDI